MKLWSIHISPLLYMHGSSLCLQIQHNYSVKVAFMMHLSNTIGKKLQWKCKNSKSYQAMVNIFWLPLFPNRIEWLWQLISKFELQFLRISFQPKYPVYINHMYIFIFIWHGSIKRTHYCNTYKWICSQVCRSKLYNHI